MSLHPIKKSDITKKWMRDREIRPSILIPPEYHLIATEGTKTEPMYFLGLKNELERTEGGLYRGRIEIKGLGTSCLKLLEDAENFIRIGNRRFDHIWLVYDKDDFPADAFDNTLHRCEALSLSGRDNCNYHALWSNQCIELWFLLHFDYFDTNISRDGYIEKLSEYLIREDFGKYEKNRADIYEILRPKLALAKRNTKKLRKTTRDTIPSHCAPGSNVYELFEMFDKYLAR